MIPTSLKYRWNNMDVSTAPAAGAELKPPSPAPAGPRLFQNFLDQLFSRKISKIPQKNKDWRYIHVTCAIWWKHYIHVHTFLMGLERIFGDFDARPPTYLIHFKWTFDVDISTPKNKSPAPLLRLSHQKQSITQSMHVPGLKNPRNAHGDIHSDISIHFK